MRLPQPVRAALRTFLQSWTGTFIGLWAMSGIDSSTFSGVSDLQVIAKMAVGAAIGSVPGILAFVQNTLENSTGHDFLISKRLPDPGPTDPPNPQPPVVPSENDAPTPGTPVTGQ